MALLLNDIDKIMPLTVSIGTSSSLFRSIADQNHEQYIEIGWADLVI
jgi:hypothetical protein